MLTKTAIASALLLTSLALLPAGVAELDAGDWSVCRYWERTDQIDADAGVTAPARGCSFFCPPTSGEFGGGMYAHGYDPESPPTVFLSVQCNGIPVVCTGETDCHTETGAYVGASQGSCAGTATGVVRVMSIQCFAYSTDPVPIKDCIETPPADICLKDFCIEVWPITVCVDKIIADFADVTFTTSALTPAMTEAICNHLTCAALADGLAIFGNPGHSDAMIVVDGDQTLGLTCGPDARCTTTAVFHETEGETQIWSL